MNTVWKTPQLHITGDEDPVLQLLEMRGVEDPEAFLRITKKKLHNPYKMRGMKAAVKRIIRAIRNREKIRIYGDYDADGVSSTSLWMLVLKELDADVDYYVPNRFTDGYGVNIPALDRFKQEDVDLIITCDTGITAIAQVAHAKKLGMDIIVTDHHEPQFKKAYDEPMHSLGRIALDDKNTEFLIPDCIVVNPKRPDCRYPFKSLAGVGVSFKILCAITDKYHPLGKVAAYQYMDLVALGTMADLMDVIDENRVIGRLGLNMMSKTTNRGLYQLLKANDLIGKDISSKDVGWTIAPCINAAGRIVSAEQAVDMLISENKMDAYRYAKKLVEINKERKELTKNYVEPVVAEINARQEKSPTAIVVHYYSGIPEGIVGLVAARVSNHFYKPAIILTDAEEDGVYKGSGRSIEAFDLFRSLMQYTNLLEGFGGHKAACGMSLHAENFEQFRDQLEFYADSVLSAADLQKKVYIDAIVRGDILDEDFIDDIMRLEPFGNANKRPVFMMSNLTVIKAFTMGAAKNHIKILASDGKRTFDCVGWFMGEKWDAIGKPKKIDIAFFPGMNTWAGKTTMQLELEDVREAVVYGKGNANNRKKTKRK